MKLFDKAIATYKSGKRVKETERTRVLNSSNRLRLIESNRSISLSEYPYPGGNSSDEASIYEWSIGDNLSDRMTTNDNSSESEFDELNQNSISESVCRDDTDPLNELVSLCPRDAPVKSPLKSSTMRLDVNQDHSLLLKSIPKDERNREKESGPVDVDDFLDLSGSERGDSVSQLTEPHYRATRSDSELGNIKTDLRVVKLSIENLELQETEANTAVELNYSISTGFSSYNGSEGDSLRNLGDGDMEFNNKLQNNKQNFIPSINPGLTSWLMQGKFPGENARAVRVPGNMLSPKRQSKLASLETNGQHARTPRKSKRNSTGPVGGRNIKTGIIQSKIKLSLQKAKRKKSIKRQVISTFQTFLRSNTTEIECKKKDSSKVKPVLQRAELKKHLSCISMIPMTGDDEFTTYNSTTITNLPITNKRKLKKETSCISTTPLTGGTVIEFPNNPKLQNAKEILLEKERKQILAYSQQRRRIKKQEIYQQRQRCEEELKRQQKFSLANKERQVNKTQTSDIMAVVENNRNRRKLQNWVMGCSNLTLEDHTGSGVISSALPWLYDSKKLASGLSINTAHDASTAMVDNTLPNPNNLTRCREESKKVDANISDEISSASTPEAAAPSLNKKLCVVCGKHKRTHLALPCMHFSYCGDCVVELRKNNVKECIVCNERNITFSKVLF